ncbi:uncharacterized protein LOC127262440 [Andrographis paniculata]|uniref:uncharacterized protein LOC127262440 n=1 Tax=Andrographis paniculata TaxID=175694 RepID=UPI0021E7CD78|nr:uncharacterized protein LOC127262440 [Andrographis paniculata]
MYGRRTTTWSILEVLSLNPLPYPVLLILGVIFLFLGLQWYVTYESVVEATEESMGWLLMAAPLLILFAVRWLSAWDGSTWWFGGGDRRRRNYYFSGNDGESGGGASPWGVALLIVLLLVMVQYQSVFLEGWFI